MAEKVGWIGVGVNIRMIEVYLRDRSKNRFVYMAVSRKFSTSGDWK